MSVSLVSCRCQFDASHSSDELKPVCVAQDVRLCHGFVVVVSQCLGLAPVLFSCPEIMPANPRPMASGRVPEAIRSDACREEEPEDDGSEHGDACIESSAQSARSRVAFGPLVVRLSRTCLLSGRLASNLSVPSPPLACSLSSLQRCGPHVCVQESELVEMLQNAPSPRGWVLMTPHLSESFKVPGMATDEVLGLQEQAFCCLSARNSSGFEEETRGNLHNRRVKSRTKLWVARFLLSFGALSSWMPARI